MNWARTTLARAIVGFCVLSLVSVLAAPSADAFTVDNATIFVTPSRIICPPPCGTAQVVVTLSGSFDATDVTTGTTAALVAEHLFDINLVSVNIPNGDVALLPGVPGHGILQYGFTVHCYQDGAGCHIEGWNDATGDLVEVTWDPDGPAPPASYGPYPPVRVNQNGDGGGADLALEVSGEGFTNWGSARVDCVYTTAVPDEFDPRALGLRAVPNPAKRVAGVAFTLPRATSATIDVYDLRGRLVRRLLTGQLPSGVHRVDWDLKDRDLRDVVPGIYLIRLTSPLGRRVAPVVAIR